MACISLIREPRVFFLMSDVDTAALLLICGFFVLCGIAACIQIRRCYGRRRRPAFETERLLHDLDHADPVDFEGTPVDGYLLKGSNTSEQEWDGNHSAHSDVPLQAITVGAGLSDDQRSKPHGRAVAVRIPSVE